MTGSGLLRGLQRRFPSWRFAFVSASLVGTTLISAVGAYHLHLSAREHERSVDRLLVEHARSVSRTFGDLLIAESRDFRYRVMAPVLGAGPENSLGVDPLALFLLHARPVMRREGFADDPWLGFFRMDLRTGAVRGAEAAVRPGVPAQLRARVREAMHRWNEDEDPLVARFDVDGEPLSLFFVPQLGPTGEPVAALGVTYSRRRAVQITSRQIVERMPLLPPSLIDPDWKYDGPPVRSDSLLSVTVHDHQGRLLFRSAPGLPEEVSGEFVFRTDAGGFGVRTGLSPRVVAQIRAAYRQHDRSRIAVALPFLALLLAASAILHLLRERELVQERRNFVAAVSHELRTPLAQIQLCAETLLRRRDRAPERVERWLGVIRREAHRMDRLVENILVSARLECREIRVSPEPADLGPLVREIVTEYEDVAGRRDAALRVDVAPELVARVDPGALRHVLGNLIDNALKYGPPGQTIRLLGAPAADGQAELAVEDQGPGIPPRDRERVWEAFERLDRRGGSAGGTGLGLAVVRGIVAGHGGSAWAEEAPGGGARFVLRFPLAPRPAEGSVERSGPPAAAALPPQ